MSIQLPAYPATRTKPARLVGALALASLLAALVLSFSSPLLSSSVRAHYITRVPASSLERWEYNVSRDAGNLGLSEQQCVIAFPKLFKPIEQSMARLEKPITHADTVGDIHWGELRAMIYDNEVRFPCLLLVAPGTRR